MKKNFFTNLLCASLCLVACGECKSTEEKEEDPDSIKRTLIPPPRVDDKPARVDDKPARVDDKPAGVDDKPARVDDNPAGVDDKPARVDDKPAGVGAVDQVILPNQPQGLQNIGNSCYMNAALQVLFGMETLNDRLLSLSESDVNRKNPEGSGGKVLDAYIELCRKYRSGEKISVDNLRKFKKLIGMRNPLFSDKNQHDLFELFLTLLDALNEDLNQSDVATTGIELHGECEVSPITDMFCCVDKTEIVYSCKHREVSKDPFVGWMLPIPPKSSNTLEDCINLWGKTEITSEMDKLTCKHCGKIGNVQRTTSIEKFAPYLLIKLRRFNDAGPWYVKNPAEVRYPSVFDAFELVQGAGKYELISVICHLGNTIYSGHYINYTKKNVQWYWCSDGDVRRVTEVEALSHVTDVTTLVYGKNS
ncbi:MAG: ubiquitin carboxyl-terminal hydrolase [Cytophagales bacterium]|jgi:ubiquitin C-terminal hydrolase|nr:ubiquitin carboxyl-terminal hydrolase [Cytophagales bacterium]